MLKRLLIVISIFLSFVHCDLTAQCTPVIGTDRDVTEGCAPIGIKFLNNTVLDGGCIVLSTLWDFGDGTTSTGSEPTHEFTAGALGQDTVYNVTFTIEELSGAITSTSIAITVYGRPESSFNMSLDTACMINDVVNFSNSSGFRADYTYNWDYGDLTAPGNSYNSTHIYNTPGDYTVALTVSDTNGCAQIAEKNITVNEIPNPNFTLSEVIGCHPMSVEITNTTPEGTFPITDWAWNYGGLGTEDTDESSGFSFEDPGIYSVTLSTINSAGCSNSTAKNVFVNETPTSEFVIPEEACKGDTVTATYAGSGTFLGVYTWSGSNDVDIIDLGRGPIRIKWDSTETQTFELEVEENGCTSSSSETIFIHDLPIVELTTDASNDSICEDQEITFTALPDSFVTFLFYDRDSILLQDSPENEFLTSTLDPANEISVFAVDSNQCASSAMSALSITVLPKPLIGISADLDTICQGEEVNFFATNGFDFYEWFNGFVSLEDSTGSTITLSNLEDGDLVHAVATQDGCRGEQSNKELTTVIDPLEVPQLNCGPSNNNGVEFIWEEVDGADSYEIATTLDLSLGFGVFDTTNLPNKYSVFGLSPGDSVWAKLVAHGKFPCGNSLVSDSIFCIAQPCDTMIFTPGADTSLCFGDSVLLQVSNIISPTSRFALSWNNGPFNKDSSFYVFPFEDSLIQVALIDSFQLGCPAYMHEFSVTVNPIPLFGIVKTGDTLCLDDEFEIESTIPGYDSYQFYLEDSLLADSAFHIFSSSNLPQGNNKFTLTVTDKGCQRTDTTSVFIHEPVVPVLVTNVDSVCEGDNIIYSVNDDYLYYSFGNPTGSLDEYQDSTINTFITSIYGSVNFQGEDRFGCFSDIVRKDIIIKALPETNLILIEGSTELCLGDSVLISATDTTFDIYELWNDYNLESTTEEFRYNFQPDSGSFYYLRAIDDNCVGKFSDSLQFSVDNPLEVPEPNCGLTGNGVIRFFWDDIDRANSYQYREIEGGLEGALESTADNSLLFNNLLADDTVCIQVQSVGPGACGRSDWSEPVCCVMPCQPVDFQLNRPNVSICEGESIDLRIFDIVSPTNNFEISWSGYDFGDTLAKRITPSVSLEIPVTVRDTTQAHCIPTTKTFDVQVKVIPEVTLIGDTLYCGDEQAILTATPTSYDNYQFFDGFLPIASGLNPTQIDSLIEDGHSYSVVAEKEGCYDTSNVITIEVIDRLQIPSVYCGRSSITEIEVMWDSIPGATGYQISINGFPWTDPNSGPLGFSNLSEGFSQGDSIVAKVRALSDAPCFFTEESELITCKADTCGFKNFQKTLDFESCEGEIVTLNLTDIISPTDSFAFSWDGGVSYFKDSTLALPIYTDTIITVSMIDSSQLVCPALVKQIRVAIQETPVMTVLDNFENDSLCEGEILELVADTIGYDSYQFFINDVLVQDSLFFQFSTDQLSPGEHEVKVTTEDNGCFFQTDSTVFEVVAFPEISLFSSDNNDTICFSDEILFNTNNLFESYEYYLNGALAQQGESDSLITSSLNNLDQVSVIGINQRLCRRESDTIVTTVIDIPNVVLTSSATGSFCEGDTISFTATPLTLDSLVIFINGDSIFAIDSLSFIYDSLQNEDEIFVSGSQAGCDNSSNIIINSVEFRPTAETSSDTNEVCVGEEVQLMASGGDSFFWRNDQNSDEQTSNIITVTPDLTTTYIVTTTTGACTSWNDSITVFVDADVPVADGGIEETICRGDSIQLNASGGDNFKWLSDSISNDTIFDPYVSPYDSRVFLVEVFNQFCRDTAEVFITVDRCLEDIQDEVPQIITPKNPDGVNDVLYIRDVDYFTKSRLTVFNRWSNKVYESSPYLNEWRGQNNRGNDLPDGTYYYILELGEGFPTHTGFVIIHN